MDNDDQLQVIPRYGNAGVAFLGVEVNDTYLLIASVFVGLFSGSTLGMPGYIGIPAGGYFLTRLYLDWKSGHLPGSLRTFLFRKGFAAYSKGFREQNIIYHGDAVIINKTFTEQEIEMLTPYLEKNKNGIK